MASDAETPPTDGLPKPRRFLAIGAISFGTALIVIDGSIATVALPTIAADLGIESSAAALVVVVYQLVLVMTLLPFSALGDRVGHRRLYQYGQLAFAVATILCLFANTLAFLLAVRAVQALGAAATLSVSSAMIRTIYPSGQLGRGLGINSVIVAISTAFAPALGGAIIAVAPWRWVFVAAAPFAFVSLMLGRALPDPVAHSRPFDYLGAILCAATFGLVIAGFESAVHGDAPVLSGTVIASGIIVGFFFVRRELGEPAPIMPFDLLRKPVFALSALGALASFVAMMVIFLSLPFRLQQGYGMSPAEIGATLTAWPLTMMVVTPIAGTLSDRVPAGFLGGVGMALASCGLLLIGLLPTDAGAADVAWRLALTGGGFGLFQTPNSRVMVGSAPGPRAAAAGGLISTNRLIGQTLGASLAAALLASAVGAGGVPGFIAAGLTLIAGLCSIARLSPAVGTGRRAAPG